MQLQMWNKTQCQYVCEMPEALHATSSGFWVVEIWWIDSGSFYQYKVKSKKIHCMVGHIMA